MSYVCEGPGSFQGMVCGDGQCVAFVKEAAGAPATGQWAAGTRVKGNRSIRTGTAIATFTAEGTYASHAHGNHAAIYVGQDASGLWVWDQWVGQPVHKRLIRFKAGKGSPSNDGDAFSIIE